MEFNESQSMDFLKDISTLKSLLFLLFAKNLKTNNDVYLSATLPSGASVVISEQNNITESTSSYLKDHKIDLSHIQQCRVSKELLFHHLGLSISTDYIHKIRGYHFYDAIKDEHTSRIDIYIRKPYMYTKDDHIKKYVLVSLGQSKE